ncbi:hypothetical protein GCU60_00510 [Blastococcus saxobsidens]|uniref:O-antigen/teichoic acid export membrane protein n=1 Tax=Blastococcus saxobsidens TaxID=138336 RepID=A0A6L9VX89_9ACTN|nr:hypothetical protein [Blastococcus saxobsidens]NEK84258.1 hypothetical protein [Blastococcus saxobsidens]
MVIEQTSVGVFAAISLVWGLTAFFPIADLGAGAAITSAAAASEHPTSDHEVIALYASALRSVSLIGLLLAGTVSTASSFEIWSSLLGGSTRAIDVDAAIASFVTVSAINVPLALIHRYALAIGRQIDSILALGAASAATPAIVAACLATDLPTWSLGSAAAISLALSNLALIVWASRRRWFPAVSILRRTARRSGPGSLSLLARTGSAMFAITLAQALALQSDRIILDITNNQYEMARYALAALLYTPALSVLSAAGLALWPQLVRLRAASEPGQQTFSILARTPVGLSIVLALGAWAAAFPVNSILSPEVEFSGNLTAVFGLLLVIQGFTMPFSMLLTRPKELRFQAVCVLAMGIANVPMSVALSVAIGAPGPVLASATCVFLFQLIPMALYSRFSVRQIGDTT